LHDFSNFLNVQTKTAWGRTLAEFASFCDPEPGSLIVDVGCGPGLLPAIFARNGHIAFGIDSDFSLLSSLLSLNLIQADALALPFPPGTFHLVTATNLLFLLDDHLEPGPDRFQSLGENLETLVMDDPTARAGRELEEWRLDNALQVSAGPGL